MLIKTIRIHLAIVPLTQSRESHRAGRTQPLDNRQSVVIRHQYIH